MPLGSRSIMKLLSISGFVERAWVSSLSENAFLDGAHRVDQGRGGLVVM